MTPRSGSNRQEETCKRDSRERPTDRLLTGQEVKALHTFDKAGDPKK